MTTTTRPSDLSAIVLKPSGVLLSIALVVLLGLGLGLLAQPSASGVAGRLPAGFPTPANAQEVSTLGDVVTLEAPGSAADAQAFFSNALPLDGWTVEAWDGTDPYGAAATGFIIERGAERGALSIVENGPGVRVEINMNQPVNPQDAAGAKGGHGAHGSD